MVHVLLVEDNPGDSRLIQEILAESKRAEFLLESAPTLASGLTRLAAGDIDVVLLDLSLADSSGLETFRRAQAEAPGTPIIVLSGQDDDMVALAAVNEGAQDFLSKNRLEGALLARAIRYAIERHRLLEQVRQLAILDPLTGLHNRRGFTLLCQHHWELAHRHHRRLAILFIDLDGMKAINDRFGHPEGDRALIETAGLLRANFRKSDVLGRLGGDEFVALLTESTPEGARVAVERLQLATARANAGESRPYRLSLSVGVAWHEPDQPASIETVIDQADRAMYAAKLARRSAA